MAKGAEEIATGLRTGAGYGEMLSKAVDKIPIVGQFRQAGEAIRELITGEKAELEMLKKKHETLDKINAKFREMAHTQAGLGKYGDEKAKIGIDKTTNDNIAKLHAEREEVTAKLQEIEGAAWAVGGVTIGYTDKQKAQMEGLKKQQRVIDIEGLAARKAGDQAQSDQLREARQRELEYERSMFERKEAFKATAAEKLLRREGKGLESAIHAINKQAEAEKRANNYTLDNYKMDGLDPNEKGARRSLVADENADIERERIDKISEYKDVMAQKEFALAQSHARDLQNLERDTLKIRLDMVGNHLGAELAMIRATYADEIAEVNRKYLDEGKSIVGEAAINEKVASFNKEQAAVEAAQFKDREGAYQQHLSQMNRDAEKFAADSKRFEDESLTPAQKFQERFYDLKAARNAGKIKDDATLARLLSKANDEFGSSLSSEAEKGNRKSGAETRRFDFALPGQGAQVDPMQELKMTAKQQAKILEDSNRYLADIWRIQKDAAATKSNVVDF